jgi:histidinol-phosphate aminotransferase
MNTYEQLATPGIRGLHPYQPGKPIEELERELGIANIIKLASNENPLGPSPVALTAVTDAAKDIWLYPDGNGFRLKQRLAQLHGVDLAAITLGNGSSDLLEFVVRVLVNPGDEVLYSQHAFAIYPIVTRAAGGVPVETPAKDWGYDLDALLAAITDKSRVIFIANPNNPTGTYVRGEALEAFLQAVPAQVVVVVDEAYFDYASHPATGAVDYPDTSQWLGRYPNLMVTRTFSKSYGLAGLRVGYGVCHPQLADLMNRVRPPFNVNSLALAGAEAALGDTAHLARSVAMNAEGLRQLEAGFEAMGLDYIPSVGNFISVDVRREAAPLFTALLHEGVIVRPVANYGMPHHLRVTVGRPEENSRFLAALAKVLA